MACYRDSFIFTAVRITGIFLNVKVGGGFYCASEGGEAVDICSALY
jgi:hypothetical protein